DFFLHQRHEPIFSSIGELGSVDWRVNRLNGLPLLIVGWPALIAWRARRIGLDLVELSTCALFTALALSAQRFTGFYALAAAPYLSRDLVELLPRPAWRVPRSRPARAALCAAACALVGLPEWSRPELPLGIGFDLGRAPVAAC